MTEYHEQAAAASTKASEPSLIQSFDIFGLYGYRDIGFSSQSSATILIARNGTGKTTLLGALDAFLHIQIGRLRNLDFRMIRCKLRSLDTFLELTREDVAGYFQGLEDPEVIRLATRTGLDPAVLFNYVADDWDNDVRTDVYYDSKHFQSIVSAFRHSYTDARSALDSLRTHLVRRVPGISAIDSSLRTALAGYDIVYLPTYRRIELALTEEKRDRVYRRRRRQKFNIASGSLFTGDIQFGLSDISERLEDLNQQITFDSDNGYREISADIINELIDGSFQRVSEEQPDIPSEDELKIFFQRIEQGRRSRPYPPVTIPNLKKLYGGDTLPAESRIFLNFFLGKLASVVDASKAVEAPVDGFINSCNKYLLEEEPSTNLGRKSTKTRRVDGKRLLLNRNNLTVTVESSPEGREISLDALSSGEKQMISLFARLFLYSEKKIVLIDEPELSLSIDWQMKILVDILNAPLCEQVIAITHSPFVFQNELEPFARSLTVRTTQFGN